jgi:hypothetical protein
VRLDGHFHSKLTEVEDECWVHSRDDFQRLKASGQLSHADDCFYFRTTIDTTDMRVLEGGPPVVAEKVGLKVEGGSADLPKRRGRPPKRKLDE